MIEFIKMSNKYISELSNFLVDNKNDFFTPHIFDEKEITNIIKTKDKYYLLIYNNVLQGYGMLRGFEEEYEIPSLGIIIGKEIRGLKISYLFMDYLEMNAKLLKCKKIRLTVFKENKKAISLYKKMNYIFQEYTEESLLGIKKI